MSTEDNLTSTRRIFEECWSKGNLALIDELLASNYVDHDPASPGGELNRDQFKQNITMYRTAFPDLKLTIDEQYAVGDNRVVTRWTGRGTHKGALMGMPATGKQGTVSGLTLSLFENGKSIGAYTNWDTLGLMQQLGLIPTAPQAAVPADVRPQQAH